MTITLTLLAAGLLYAGTALIWPRKPCRRCKSDGKLFSPVGTSHRPCPSCNGDGWHLRVPARLYNRYRRRHR